MLTKQNLQLIDEWLTELEEAAQLRVASSYDPATTTPQQTAYLAGTARGITEARAYIQLMAKNLKAEDD